MADGKHSNDLELLRNTELRAYRLGIHPPQPARPEPQRMRGQKHVLDRRRGVMDRPTAFRRIRGHDHRYRCLGQERPERAELRQPLPRSLLPYDNERDIAGIPRRRRSTTGIDDLGDQLFGHLIGFILPDGPARTDQLQHIHEYTFLYFRGLEKNISSSNMGIFFQAPIIVYLFRNVTPGHAFRTMLSKLDRPMIR